MMLTWLVILIVLGVVTLKLMALRLPPAPTQDQDRRLAEQAEQIEQLEAELRLVKEQADFTEKLLTERSAARDEPGRDPPKAGGAPPP